MTSEPQSKRRRKDEFPMEDSDEDEDDDELVFQPFKIEAKQDPGYKLSIERAYADHRFQATMAHIFEKYGRDFEGIGDEIDLVTGEIVVNNGHVRNMRNEGDVGDHLDQEEEDDEEDEGILLEDLTDGEDGQDAEDDEGDQDPGQEDVEDEDEEERIMHGHEPPHNSTALVPVSGLKTPAGSWGGQMPGLLPGAYGYSPLGFGTSSLGFDTSPFGFDASPFHSGPWDIPGPFSEPTWGYPPAQTPQSAFAGHRYKFKAREGQSSIWARRSRYKESEDEPLRSVFNLALDKHLARSKTKNRKSHPTPAISQKPTDDDEDDEEAILSGKSAKGKRQTERRGAHGSMDANNDEVDDNKDLLPASRMVIKQPKSQEKEIGQDGHKIQPARRGRKRKRNVAEDVSTTENMSDASFEEDWASKIETQAEQPDNSRPTEELGDRRRSGRMRKQVEFLNKISWSEALAQRRSPKMRIEIPSVDPRSRSDYQEVEADGELDNEPVSSEEEVELSASSTRIDGLQKFTAKGVIPDSEQNSSQDFNNTQEEPPDQERDQLSKGAMFKEADSACVLSDDEAPVLLSKRRGPGRPSRAESSKEQGPPTNPNPNTDFAEASAESRTINKDESQNEVTNLSTLPKAYTEETHNTDEGKDGISDNTGHFQVSCEVFDEDDQHHEPGLPGDYSSDNAVENEAVGETEEIPNLPPRYPGDAAPFSSSPTRALTRFTAEVSLSDKSARLSREVRWLRAKAASILSSSPSPGETLSSLDASGAPRKRRGPGRPKKSISVVEQPAPTDEHADQQKSQQPAPSKAPSEIPDSTQDTTEEPPIETALPSPRRTASPPHSPSKPTSLSKLTPLPKPTVSLPTKNPETPRQRHRLSTRAPSSRRSILSLLSDNEDDAEIDELGRNLAAMPKLFSSGNRSVTTARRIWKSSALTTEVYHTPVKKRPQDPVSPGSLIRTPGGTMRTCGLDGYRCGRDFCFTCL